MLAIFKKRPLKPLSPHTNLMPTIMKKILTRQLISEHESFHREHEIMSGRLHLSV